MSTDILYPFSVHFLRNVFVVFVL